MAREVGEVIKEDGCQIQTLSLIVLYYNVVVIVVYCHNHDHQLYKKSAIYHQYGTVYLVRVHTMHYT